MGLLSTAGRKQLPKQAFGMPKPKPVPVEGLLKKIVKKKK